MTTTLSQVQQILAERLALPLDRITPEARIFEDLGSDSLDLLDLLFTLEKRFSIKLRNSELDQLLRGEFQQREFSQEDLTRLQEWLPGLEAAPRPVNAAALFSYITVASLAQVVDKKVAEVAS